MDLNSSSDTEASTPVRKVPGGRFAPKPTLSPEVVTKHPISILLDDKPQSDVVLPGPLQPAAPIAGSGVSTFYMLDDGKTGVLALGSFSAPSFDAFEQTLLSGLQTLVGKGATRLIVDVVSRLLKFIILDGANTPFPQTNNGGGTYFRGSIAMIGVDADLYANEGFICIAHVGYSEYSLLIVS